MGHDWTAIKDYNEELKEENKIACLRRGMSSKTIHELYEFLECTEVNGRVSGKGHYVIIDLEVIEEAIPTVIGADFNDEDKDDYIEFLYKIIKYCKENKQKGVIIFFS